MQSAREGIKTVRNRKERDFLFILHIYLHFTKFTIFPRGCRVTSGLIKFTTAHTKSGNTKRKRRKSKFYEAKLSCWGCPWHITKLHTALLFKHSKFWMCQVNHFLIIGEFNSFPQLSSPPSSCPLPLPSIFLRLCVFLAHYFFFKSWS